MATWASFYIKTTEKDKAVEKLKSLSGITQSDERSFPNDHYNSFILDEAYPNYLVVGMTQPEWVTIVYNSSSKLVDWCTNLSKEFSTLVVVTLAQSVSDYYYFACYDKGQKLRELEFCYSDDFEEVNFGKRFDFENEQPGQKTEFDGEVEYCFDFDSIEEYCKHFSLIVQNDYDKTTWAILKGPGKGKTVKEHVMNYKKPWWKFW